MDWRELNATMTHPRSPSCRGEHQRMDWLLAWAEIGWHAAVDIRLAQQPPTNMTITVPSGAYTTLWVR